MDTRTLDRLVPAGYAILLLASALFFRVALAPIAIFGALGLALYYVALRPHLVAVAAARRARENPDSVPPPPADVDLE